MRKTIKTMTVALTVVLAAAAPIRAGAAAGQSGRGRDVVQGWDRGQWTHGSHDGRTGWWWTVGPSWYWYENPSYPYPAYPFDPPENVAPDYTALGYGGQASDEHWYYCESPRGYYPYIAACRGDDWRIVPVDPSQGIHRTAGGPQYYCNEPAGYYPIVADCKREWRIVPSVAPPR